MQKIVTLVVITFVLITSSSYVFARGGGGGSSSGGSSGGSSSSGGSYSSSGGSSGNSEPSCSSKSECSKSFVIFFVLFYSITSIGIYKNRNKNGASKNPKNSVLVSFLFCLFLAAISSVIFSVGIVFVFVLLYIFFFGKISQIKPSVALSLEGVDKVYAIDIKQIFLSFQKAWCEFDVATLEKLVSPKFHQLLVLQLAILKNEKRENRMNDIILFSASILENTSAETTSLRILVNASANDILYDTEIDKNLYEDSSEFSEYWNFILDNGVWKLDSIDQTTANSFSVKKSITDFAQQNNFFYNPDFGWLMIPNKGNLFSQASFKTSDVNNHVIGVYKNKIVEFYSIRFAQGGEEYFIGQAILPKSYNRIVIERKNKFSLIERIPKGLRKIEMESILFNNEFNVYSDNADTMTTFELLHPAYMEYIMGLPYKVNIEVVGNTVYFYTTSREVDYNKLLEILSRAFDEIKE